MTKAATIQVRIDTDLKRKVDVILKHIGMNASQVVNALYAQIAMQRGMPFELKIPNKETLEAIEELESGGGKRYANFQEMIKGLDEGDA